MKDKVFSGRPPSAVLVCLLLSLTSASFAQQKKSQSARTLACDCGPDYCLGDSRYPKLVAAKKKKMLDQGYPADLVNLLDRDGACVAAVENGPDAFRLKVITGGGSTNIEWTSDGEALARKQLLSGAIKAYYKFNTNRALACCGEKKYNERPDWDSNLDLNRNLAIGCTKSGSSIVCK